MVNLKERFENYSKEPDERVWEKIEGALEQKAAARRRRTVTMTVAAAVALAIVGSVAVASVRSNTADETLTARTEQGMPTVNTGSDLAKTDMAKAELTESGLYTVEPEQEPTAMKEQATSSTATTAECHSPTPDETTPGVPTMRQANALQTVATPAITNLTPLPTPTSIKPVSSRPTPTAQPTTATQQTVATAHQPANESVEEENDLFDMKAPSDTVLITIPNAFSPDDLNAENAAVRTFKVYASTTANLRSFEMFIYSRRGGLVYHSRDIEQGWDGTSKGKALPMGTYVYVIEINDALAGLKHYTGTVTLLR